MTLLKSGSENLGEAEDVRGSSHILPTTKPAKKRLGPRLWQIRFPGTDIVLETPQISLPRPVGFMRLEPALTSLASVETRPL